MEIGTTSQTGLLQAVDSKTASLLAAKPIQRFPRLSAKDTAAIEDRVAELDAKVFRAIARRREASIEAGRAFRELKKILGHGKWEKHFAETFVPHGISLRTAQRWMRRARKADKHDKLSFFKSATDRGAQDIKDAGQQAETVVETAKVKMAALYRLPLRLTDEEKAAVDALRKLAEWSQMEKEIVCVLQRLCRQHGILNKNVRRPS